MRLLSTISILLLCLVLCATDASAQGLRAQRFRGIQLVGPTESGQTAQKNQGVALLAPPNLTTSYALIFPSTRGLIGQSLVVGSTDGTNAAFLTWTTPLTAATGWTLPGNTGAVSTGLIGAVPTGARLGTTDGNDLRIVTDDRVRMIITSAGAISLGGPTSINDNLNNITNINTGTSSGSVNIGGSSSTTAILGTTTINATGVAGTTIGNTNPTTSVAINSGSTGGLTLGGLPTVTSSNDDVLLISGTNQISRITQVNLFGNAWQMTGNPVTDPVNQYLGSNNAQPLVIRTNATERLRITSNGLVQIGAASGSSTLNVTGTFDLTGNATIGGSLAVTGLITGSSGGSITGVTNINTTGAATTTIGNASATNAIAGVTTITGGTSINTTGTSSTTIGNASSTTSITGTVNVNTSGNGNTTIGNTATTGTTTIATNGVTGQLVISGLQTPATSSNDVMLINGTTGQVQKITQANLFAGQGWALTGNSITAGGTAANQQFIGTTNAQPLVIATTQAQPIAFFTGNSERMRLTSTGRLGIGSNSPAQLIHLSTATEGDAYGIAFGNQGSGYGALLVKNNTFQSQVFDFYFGRHGGQAGAQLRFWRDQATEVVRIMGSGDVGIGVFPPARRLDVAGTVGATGMITGTGGITISGAASGINVGSNFATDINTGSSTGNVTIGGTGAMSILIGNGTGVQTISLGTGITGAKTVTLGSTAGTSTTTIQSGSNGVNINASNNQPTNINTGTSTGIVAIGGSSTTTNILGTVNINATGNANTLIGNSSGTGIITIATSGSAGQLLVTGLETPATSSSDVMIVNATTGRIQKITQANLFAGQGWSLTGNAGTTNGGALGLAPTGNFVGTTGTAGSARDLAFVTNNVVQVRISTDGVLSAQNDITVNSVNLGTGTGNTSVIRDLNTAVGREALSRNTGGNYNTAVGRTALGYNTSGANNTGLGSFALSSNTTGAGNTAVGNNAISTNTTGNYNSALGLGALQNTNSTGGATGNFNTAVGASALLSNTTGYNNSALGGQALQNNTTGFFNTAVGASALVGSTDGTYNVGVGYLAGAYLAGGSPDNTSGTYNVYVGAASRSGAASSTNEIVLGSSNTGLGSNSVILGNSSITVTRLQGRVGVGVDPTAAANVTGLFVRAGSSQSTNTLFEAQNNAGTALVSISASGAITGTGGATLSGAATSINASSNFNTDINTGSSTGIVAIGGSSTTTNILGTTNINATGSANTTIGNSGTTTIATNSTSGRLVISGLPTGTSEDVLLINGSNQVSRITQTNLFAGQGWSLTGNNLSTPTTQYLGSNNATPLNIRTNSLERMRVTSDGLVLIGSTSGTNTLDVTGTFGVVGAASINTTGSAVTNINTGASTGNVAIGGSGAMSILIGNGTGVQTISLGDGITGAKTVTLGSTAGTSTTTIQSGSGNVNINNNSNQATNINSGTSTGAVNIGAGASSGTVTIGGNGSQSVLIGNGAAAKTVSLGSSNTTSTTTLLSGSGGLNLNASNNQPTNINTGTSSGAVNIGTSLTTVTVLGPTNINTTGSTAGTTIGNTTAATAVTINTGTTGRLTLGGLPVQTATTDEVLLINGSNQVSRITQANLFAGQGWSLTGNNLSTPTTQYLGSNNATPLNIRTNSLERMRVTSDGLVLIGSTSGTNTLDVTGTFGVVGAASINTTGSAVTNINTGASTGNVAIGGSGVMSILIGNGTGVQTISLGDGGTGAKTVTLGSTASTSTTTIQSGSGGVLINQNNNQPTSIGSGTSTGTVTIGGSGAMSILIGNGTGVQTIALGNGGTGAKTVTLGSTASTSTTTIQSGSSGVNINASNNQPTNINTGTSTGIVAIGGSSTTTNILGTVNINATGNANTLIGNSAGTGITTIATSGAAGQFRVTGLETPGTSTNDVMIINATSGQVQKITQANFFAGQGWSLTGNSLSTPTTQYLGSNNATSLNIRTNSIERMRVSSDGMVLIGSTSGTNTLDPNNGRLEVTGTSASRYGHLVVRRDNAGGTGGQLSILNLTSATVGSNAVLAFGIENSTLASATGTDESNAEIRAVLTATSGAADLRFSTWNGTANGVRLNIAADGRVGIGTGTTAPAAQLQVNSTAAATVGAIIRGASGQTQDLLELQDNAGTQVLAVASSGITGTAKTSIGSNDRVVVASSTGMLDQATPATVVSSGSIGARVATAASVDSHVINDANVTTNDIIIVTLETAASTAVIPAYTIVRGDGTFTVHFSAPFSGFVNYTLINRP